MSTPLVRIFSTGRKELASILPTVQSVSWVKNEVGQIQFYVPYTDSNCTTDILSVGNFILLEWVYPETEALPVFGGVIDVPRSRGANGVVLTAYTGEWLLGWFETAARDSLDGFFPGTMYKELIESSKVKYNPGFIEGSIYEGGDFLTKEWSRNSVLSVIRNLAVETGQDFNLTPTALGGTLSFEYNWYNRMGYDVSDKVLFAEGVNVGEAILDEQGLIANQVTVYGAGSVWDTTRLQFTATDTTSVSDYGWREISLVDQDSRDLTTVIQAAKQYLSDHKDGIPRLALTGVTDRAPGLWKDFSVGDIVSVDVALKGAIGGSRIQDKRRIVGMLWSPDNTMRLSLESAPVSFPEAV